MKLSGNKWIPFVLTVAIIVLLNVALSTVPFRADLTRGGAYSLSEASKEAVRTLGEPLTIKAYLSQALSAPYNNTEQVLRDLLEEYSLAGNRFFNYSIVSIPSKEELESGKGAEVEDEARKYGIYPIQIQTVEQDEVKLQSVYMGVAFIHGDMIETIPALTNTSNLEYQITSLINKMGKKISALLSMTDDIEVTLYLSENLTEVASSMEEMGDGIKEVVNELNGQYYGKLSFRFIDPIATGAGENLESEYGVSPLQLTRRTATGDMSEKGYAALVISHGEEYHVADLISRGIFGMQVADIESLKRTIEDVAEALIGTNEEIGFVTGYGISSLEGMSQSQAPVTPIRPELRNFNALMSREYTLKQIALPEEEIPEGLGSLVIAGPTERLSDYDLYKIDQFLMKGGSLALFLDSHSIFIPQSQQYGQRQEPAYVPRDTGLEEMLSHYGVDLKKAYVLDEQSFTQRQQDANGGIVETPIYYAPIVSNERMTDKLRFLDNIPELITLYIAPLELNGNLSADASAIPVFSSSADSWIMAEDVNLSYPQLIQPPPDDMQTQSVLAYLIEGEFDSYFMGRKIPEPPVPEPETGEPGEEAALAEGVISSDAVEVQRKSIERGNGRIFVLGSSAILGSNVLDAEGRTGNSLFIMNLFDYLNGREDYAIMRTKGVNYVPINEDTPHQLKSFIKTFNIVVLPILVAVAGVLVWVGRLRRKKRIEYFFQKGGEDAE